MSNVSQWSTTAADNDSASPNGAPENMSPAGVNDVIRENMAATSKWYKDTNGTLVSGGSSNTYTITTNNAHSALADQSAIVFRVDRANTGSATLNVDSLGAKTMKLDGSNLASGDLVANSIVMAVYNADQDVYDIIKSQSAQEPDIKRSARTSNTILGAADNGTLIDFTANTFTQTLTAAATLGDGWFCYLKNSGSGDITLDPNGSETIDGLTTLVLEKGQEITLQCDGSNFNTVKSKATILNNYLSGLTLSNNSTDSDHDLDIAIGVAANSGNGQYLNLTTALTKQIDATWASGTNAGGRSSSVSLSTNTWYHVFLVEIGGSVDVLFDTSVTCANGVTDHSVTAYRRIGSVKTDGSSNIKAFQQHPENPDWFILDNIESDFHNNITSSSAQLLTLTTPLGIKTTAYIWLFDQSTTSEYVLITDPDQTDTAPGLSRANYYDAAGADNNGITLLVGTNTSSQIRFHKSGTGTFVCRLSTMGYIDKRGQ